MLARLEEQLTSVLAFADREGQLLKVTGSMVGTNDLLAGQLEKIVESMGYSARLLTQTPGATRWFGTGDILELSKEEAGVLARSWAKELTAAGVIDRVGQVRDGLEAALFESFRESAVSGKLEPIRLDETRALELITLEQLGSVRRWIQDRTGA